jgi:hypothetical protein
MLLHINACRTTLWVSEWPWGDGPSGWSSQVGSVGHPLAWFSAALLGSRATCWLLLGPGRQQQLMTRSSSGSTALPVAWLRSLTLSVEGWSPNRC